MTKIGLILSGCGVYDGAEIHESVLTLLALSKQGATPVFLAPNQQQHHVINHQKQAPDTTQTRHIIEEAARIARGPVTPLSEINTNDLDGVIFPGGFGVAKNFCDFAFAGSKMTINPEIEQLIKTIWSENKPIGFMCIAPILAAKIIPGVRLTIGHDQETATAIETLGGIHHECSANKIIIDHANQIVTTPAYMCDAPLHEIAEGIEQCVQKVISWAKQPVTA